ncbi:hypothetical protein E2C01_090308 [Portunus trituberculatus]|uniref:Uncharacterized protein n=1 Tax=Portunus trituberculatus TaxID=210409 RepID=A0A5B7JG84_PORTR|nr:hypothetical protein [Portunus trituberculatus]
MVMDTLPLKHRRHRPSPYT